MDFSDLIKGISKEEKLYLENLIDDLAEDEQQMFLIQYKLKRRNPFVFSILTLFGFVGFAGFQRFYSRDYLMGLLQLFSLGFMFIGTIHDLMTFFNITLNSNIKIAEKTAFQIREASNRLHSGAKFGIDAIKSHS